MAVILYIPSGVCRIYICIRYICIYVYIAIAVRYQVPSSRLRLTNFTSATDVTINDFSKTDYPYYNFVVSVCLSVEFTTTGDLRQLEYFLYGYVPLSVRQYSMYVRNYITVLTYTYYR
jgi:hypothetical protein